MKVLYVVGACLTKNTSANMSHNAYIQGLLENGCQVDILMAADSWGEEDKTLPRWEEAHYYEFDSVSFSERLRRKLHSVEQQVGGGSKAQTDVLAAEPNLSIREHLSFKVVAKKLFYTIFPCDPVYPLQKKWLHEASNFAGGAQYDLVVSNSSPAASHKLVVLLQKKKRITFRRWVQIWEDPWFYDLYGGHTEAIREEEHALLRAASEIYYVSPLTTAYQKKYFDDCADKMKCIPLPFLKFSEGEKENQEDSFGYFGDYYSHTRDLKPFYDALKEQGYKGYIYGDSDLQLESTDRITISGRVTLDKLSLVQEQTGVLVHLCNLRGGQIPGKIYHYSATNKPILFILDGTAEEKKIIRAFFEPFHRYEFCDNTEESIRLAMKRILTKHGKQAYNCVDDFSPKSVVEKVLGGNYEWRN